MRKSQNDIPKKKKVIKLPAPKADYSIPKFNLNSKQDNTEIKTWIDEIVKTIEGQKQIIPESNKAEIKTNHEDLVRIITEKMNTVMEKLGKDRVTQVDVKRDRSGLIESLTFKSIEENGIA